MSRWNDHAVDILPRSGGKVLGIGQFLRRLSLDWSEIMSTSFSPSPKAMI